MKKRFVSVLLSVILLMQTSIAISAEEVRQYNDATGESVDYVEESNMKSDNKKYIVKFKNENAAKNAEKKLSKDKNKKHKGKFVYAELSNNERNSFKKNSDVLYIEEDFEVKSNTSEDEAEAQESTLWNIDAIKADSAHTENITGSGVKIAVMDSGIDVYSEVIPKGGVDLVDPTEGYGDDMTGHGTGVAGIIGAPMDDSGIIGVAPDAEIYNVKVLDSSNSANVSRIIEGLDWCIENDMDIINMSFGTDNYSRALDEKIAEVEQAGILMVSSAGNGENIQYPAKFDSVIAVGSVDSSMEKATASATGEELELVAPGENVMSTMLIGGYGAQSGTSMAAPHITGAAALLLSKDLTKSSDFIRELLSATANDLGDDNLYGNGIVDVYYGLEIYDDFETNYSETNYIVPDNDSTQQTFEDEDIFVVGQWSHDGHKGTIDYSYNQTSYNVRFPTYVKAVSKYCDDKLGKTYALHGVGNYVVFSKLLYEIAANFKVGTPNFEYDEYRIDFRNLVGITNYNTLMSSVTTALIYCHADNVSVSVDVKQDEKDDKLLESRPAGITNFASVSQKKSTIVFGMLFHLLGDIYAHRTIVPPSSVNVLDCDYHDGNGTKHNQGLYFVRSDFTPFCLNHINPATQVFKDKALLKLALNIPSNAKIQPTTQENNICGSHDPCYNALIRLAGLGVLQFKDIKYFLEGYKELTTGALNNQAYYEDRAGENVGNCFYYRRYEAAKEVTHYYFGKFYACIYIEGTTNEDDIKPFLPYYLLPIHSSSVKEKKIKIDQYYNYLEAFDHDSAVLKKSTWTANNDSLFNYTTIKYNGSYYVHPDTYRSGEKPVYYPSTVMYEPKNENDNKQLNSFYVS